MKVRIRFFSYFRDLTGCAETELEIADGAVLREVIREVHARFPRLESMRRSTLVAVGLEYQSEDHVVQPGDEIAFFPPVQGGAPSREP